MKNTIALFTSLLLIVGCSTIVQDGSRGSLAPIRGQVLLVPFGSASSDLNAGKALTEMTGTILLKKGVNITQLSEDLLPKDQLAATEEKNYLEVASEKGIPYVLTGTVTEYRYMADLQGKPAVGVTLRLIRTTSGQVLWQSSGSKSGAWHSSLSQVAQQLLNNTLSTFPAPGKTTTRRSSR